MDKLAAMRTFVAVVDAGSFAKAARKLRYSPTAVTRGVAQLEKELGIGLLTRTTRSVRTTERGTIYAERCRRLLIDLDESERVTRGESASPRGELRVAAPVMFGHLHVMPMVENLLATHPNLTIRLMLSDRIADLIDEGIDVAVRIGELDDSGLVATPIASVYKVLVASPNYLDRFGRPKSLTDLRAHQLIEFEALGSTNDWKFGTTGESAVRIKPRLSVNNAAAAINAAEHGVGITRAISYQVHASIEEGSLELVLPHIAKAKMPVHLVYAANRRGSANVVAFAEAAHRHIRQAMGVDAVRR